MPTQESYKELLDDKYSDAEKEEIIALMLRLAEVAVGLYLEDKSNVHI